MHRALLLLGSLALASGCEALAAQNAGITVEYLNETEALRVVFPGASWTVAETAVPDPTERLAIADLLGASLAEPGFRVRAGLRPDGSLDGFAVLHAEIGKFKPFDFIVGIEPSGAVRRVAILTYREARGGEVAGKRFLVQYPGKTVADPISIHRDMINISGATMSVNSLNQGVKKALAVVEVCYRRRPERLARLLASRRQTLDAAAASRPPSASDVVEVREARQVMGALCEIHAFGADRERLRQALGSAFAAIEEADLALSDWRPDSELSRVSREAADGPVTVSPLTASFLELAARLSRETRGAFDITVGPLVSAWGLRGGIAREPTPAELEAVRGRLGADRVRLERLAGGGGRVRLGARGMRLDPGALGKGFAVDLAVRRLRQAGVERALVDFAGNMYALGAPPGADAWTVAVRDASRPERIAGCVQLRDQGISSSGGYEKGIELDRKRVGHILSPATLRPVDGVPGATVIARTAAEADGYSTAACVLGEAAIEVLEAAAGVDGLVFVNAAGAPARRLTTRGWRCES
jgi:thiamine biosynthesis lipoprotein ApbE